MAARRLERDDVAGLRGVDEQCFVRPVGRRRLAAISAPGQSTWATGRSAPVRRPQPDGSADGRQRADALDEQCAVVELFGRRSASGPIGRGSARTSSSSCQASEPLAAPAVERGVGIFFSISSWAICAARTCVARHRGNAANAGGAASGLGRFCGPRWLPKPSDESAGYMLAGVVLSTAVEPIALGTPAVSQYFSRPHLPNPRFTSLHCASRNSESCLSTLMRRVTATGSATEIAPRAARRSLVQRRHGTAFAKLLVLVLAASMAAPTRLPMGQPQQLPGERPTSTSTCSPRRSSIRPSRPARSNSTIRRWRRRRR